MKLVTTSIASAATGLSEWELRRGYKAGIYPAIQIGRGSNQKRLRWDLDILVDAIRTQMTKDQDSA